MRFIYSKTRMRIGAVCLCLIFLLTSFIPVQATKEVDELEDKTSQLQSELSDLNGELSDLEKDLDYILDQIEETTTELETTKELLAAAKWKEEAQYESMMLRIKYMYENGNINVFQMLFSANSFSDLLSRAEYYITITNYDRQALEELAKTREQIAAQEAALEADQEYLAALQSELDAREEELQRRINATSDDLSKYTAKLEQAKEEARKAEEAAREEVKPITPSPGISNGAGVSHTTTDVELLAALIECEAGSTHYEGMLAVGSVVVNRMNHHKYPSTLEGVIYQKGQFTPAHNGKLDKVLQRGVKASCVTAAQDALNGKNNVGGCLSFRSASSGRDGIVIGGNVFF